MYWDTYYLFRYYTEYGLYWGLVCCRLYWLQNPLSNVDTTICRFVSWVMTVKSKLAKQGEWLKKNNLFCQRQKVLKDLGKRTELTERPDSSGIQNPKTRTGYEGTFCFDRTFFQKIRNNRTFWIVSAGTFEKLLQKWKLQGYVL